MASPLLQKMIDNGADELRRRQMSGRITRSWCDLPNADKRKWREHAEAVLNAAAAPELLEALQAARSILDEQISPNACAMADAAISRATGGAS